MGPHDFGRSGGGEQGDDAGLGARIVAAYRLALQTSLGETASMWLQGALLDKRRDVHEALLSGDQAAVDRLLRDPGRTDLFYGFEDLSRTFLDSQLPGLDHGQFATMQYLGLVELGRALGVHQARLHDWPEPPMPDAEDLLAKLDALLGVRLAFPNPFPDEVGLATSRGIMGYRGPPAIYQARRMQQLVGMLRAPRVVEIGAGLGRTAYYARCLGITDYTIVDLPISLVAQADFLARVVGPQNIVLYGETATHPGCIKLVPPSAFFESEARYDLVLNVDSMTEMARSTAEAYCRAIDARATVFLSINHEGLGFTVAELVPGGMFQRSPYWMRPGYVEELGGAYPTSIALRRMPATVMRAVEHKISKRSFLQKRTKKLLLP